MRFEGRHVGFGWWLVKIFAVVDGLFLYKTERARPSGTELDVASTTLEGSKLEGD